MDMNRITPLLLSDTGLRVGEQDTEGNIDLRRAVPLDADVSVHRLYLTKINQVIHELEKLQHICYALSRVATEDSNAQDGSDAQASDQ